jgi:hypothetical protein
MAPGHSSEVEQAVFKSVIGLGSVAGRGLIS